jgi:hypothetical protein
VDFLCPHVGPPLPQAIKNGNCQNKGVEMIGGKDINKHWKGQDEKIENPTKKKKLVKMFLICNKS